MKRNVFLLGLDDFNRGMLERLHGAEDIDFHGLLGVEDVIKPEHYPLEQMLAKAENTLHTFPGTVDGLAGYIDFPVSDMIPILAGQFDLPSPTLEAVLKCEHKYWSRVEQRKAVPEHTPQFNRFDPFADDPLDQIQLPYPFWVKPVKSFSSHLGFRIRDEKDFARAIGEIRGNIRRLGDAFNGILRHADLPAEIAGVDGNWCIAEEIVDGEQCTIEGWVHGNVPEIFGTVDSVREENRSSFARYQYPSQLPEHVRERMDYAARRFLHHIGYDNGAFNIEFFWDSERDRIWMLEVNPRISASHSPLFEMVDGVANTQASVDVALGRRPRMGYRQGRFPLAAKFMLRRFAGDALVRRVPRPEDVERVEQEIPGARVQIEIEEGKPLSALRDQDSYSYELGVIFMGARDEDELLANYERSLKLLPFEFEERPAS